MCGLSHTPAPQFVVASQVQRNGGGMRNDSLEGLRGAAALFVVLFHALPLPALQNGYLAVDLFFVLSGFVICSAYGARMSEAHFLQFVIRRFGRLWPAHIATTVISVICVYAVADRLPTLHQVVAFATMTQGLVLDNSLVSAVSWSTSDEFYVYLAFAAVCMFAQGRARISILAALAIIGYAVCLYGSVVQAGCVKNGDCLDLIYHFGWARCVAGFFIGALVAVYREARALRALSRPVPQLVVAAVALLFFSVAGAYGIALAAPVLFAALVASLASDCGPVARLFQRSVFQVLGRVSYSLYLGHGALAPAYVFALSEAHSSPIALLAVMVGFFIVCAALAYALNRFIETPFRERINAWAETTSRSRASASSSAQAT